MVEWEVLPALPLVSLDSRMMFSRQMTLMITFLISFTPGQRARKPKTGSKSQDLR